MKLFESKKFYLILLVIVAIAAIATIVIVSLWSDKAPMRTPTTTTLIETWTYNDQIVIGDDLTTSNNEGSGGGYFDDSQVAQWMPFKPFIDAGDEASPNDLVSEGFIRV